MPDNIPEAPAVPTVGTAPLPTPYDGNQASPETFGSSVAVQVLHAGELEAQIADRSREKANEIGAQTLAAKSRAALNKWVLDSKVGYVALKGADAIAKRDEYLTGFNKDLDAILAGAPNEKQRAMFAKEHESIRQQGLHHAFTHETHEQNSYASAEVRGNLDQTMTTLQGIIGGPNAAMNATGSLGNDIEQQVNAVYKSGIDAARTKYGQNASKEAIAHIVMPELQKLAVSGMETATATQNPAIAKAAFDKLGKFLVTHHQRFFAGVVEKLATKEAVTRASDAVFRDAAEVVLVPGGDPVARVNATKVAGNLAALPADSPHLADTQKAVEMRQKRLEQLWDATAANIQERVHSAGMDPVTGAFDIDARGINPVDKEWLRQHAPKRLGMLRDQDRKAQRQDSAEEQRARVEASRNNYSFASAWLYDDKNRDELLRMTRGQWGSSLMDETQYPGGLLIPDRGKALAEFDRAQKIAQGKLDEKVGATVKESLAKAFADDVHEGKVFTAKYFGALLDKANAYVKQNKGAVDTEKLREFVEKELAEHHVVGTGLFFEDRVRLIEAQSDPEMRKKYKGKTFRLEGQPDEVLRDRDEVVVKFPGVPPVPVPRAPPTPTPADTAALDWLNDPKNADNPARAGVLAKLRAKGLAP